MRTFTAILICAALLLQAFLFVQVVPTAHAYPIVRTTRPRSTGSSSPYGITITAPQFNRTTLGSGGITLPPADFHKNLTVTWARIQIGMDKLYTGGDPSVATNYNWGTLSDDFDQGILNAQSNGLIVDFALQGVPDGSFNNQNFRDSCGRPTTYVMNAYVTALMNHLRFNLFVHHPEVQGTIQALEIGNEDWSGTPGGGSCDNDPAVYASVVESVAPKIRSSDTFMSPAPLIGSEGYTKFGMVNDPQEPTQWSVNYFWTHFFQDAGNPASLLDYVNFHYYHADKDPGTPLPRGYENKRYPWGHDTFSNVYTTIQSAGVGHPKHGGGTIPIWVTEVGWTTTNCNQTSFTVSASQQSSYESTVLETSRTSNNPTETNGGVTHVFLFTADEYWGCGYDGMAISYDGVLQPAGTMLQNEIALHPSWP